MDHIDYTKIIKRDLPHLYCAINPISKNFLIKEVQNKILDLSPREWHEFSKNRGRELRRLEGTFVFNQLLKNNFVHAEKQIYQDVNEYCNEYQVPHHKRVKLFQKEMEYISLYIHDVLPLNYNEQGIHPNDLSISIHTKFFCKKDSLLVVCKKWYDYIHDDYHNFWDVYRTRTKSTTVLYLIPIL